MLYLVPVSPAPQNPLVGQSATPQATDINRSTAIRQLAVGEKIGLNTQRSRIRGRVKHNRNRYGTAEHAKRIYLLAPKHPVNFWSMQGTADILGAKTLMPNSALSTLMALTPDDVTVEYILGDENVAPIDFSLPCDLVAITGATLHTRRIHELCRIFGERGVPIALGGTYASIDPDACACLADYLFVGEAEYTWPKFLRQWSTGQAEKVYRQATYIDLKDSPAPDWSLIKARDYVNFNVQTSRGCPHQCDFCDVIQYMGREYRTKTIDQILQEVRNAHGAGARTLFFSDDNFLGNKRFTKDLLTRLLAWNTAQTRPLSFSTQITVQVADDVGLLKLFSDCKFSVLFLGVETVREESLKEVHKSHNLKYNIYERMKRISRFGIVPFLGLIVGFDHDDKTVFGDLEGFIKDTYSPIAGISLLNAPRRTPLYKRMQAEGRLVGDDFSGEWQLYTNIIPKQMKREELLTLYRNLFEKIYDPVAFESRLVEWLKHVEYVNTGYPNKKFDFNQIKFASRIFKHFLFQEDREVRSLFFRALKKTWQINPKLMRRFFTLITQYIHFYHFVKDQLPKDPGQLPEFDAPARSPQEAAAL